jgi:hypothetical protein
MQGDHLAAGDEKLLGPTDFPPSAVKVDLVKPEWMWSYVEAGIRQRYSYVMHLPDNAVALLVWAKLYHKKGDANDFYATQKVLQIIDNHWCELTISPKEPQEGREVHVGYVPA